MRASTYFLVCRLGYLIPFSSYSKTKPRNTLNVSCFSLSGDSMPLSYILPDLVKNFLYSVIFSTSKKVSSAAAALALSQHMFWFGEEVVGKKWGTTDCPSSSRI